MVPKKVPKIFGCQSQLTTWIAWENVGVIFGHFVLIMVSQ